MPNEFTPIAKAQCIGADIVNFLEYIPGAEPGSQAYSLGHLRPGETLFIRGKVQFCSGSEMLTVTPTCGGNGILVSNSQQPGCRFFPHHLAETKLHWSEILGDPAKTEDFRREYGLPSLLAVDFLGHPDRCVLAPLMVDKGERPHPITSIPLPAEKKGQERFVIFTSPAFNCDNLHESAVAFQEATAGRLPWWRQHQVAGYAGQGMIFAEVGIQNGQSFWRLAVATISRNDNLLRVRKKKWHDFGKSEKQEIANKSLAEISLLCQNIGTPDTFLIGADRELPLKLIDELENHIEGEDFGLGYDPYREMKICFGVDLRASINRLPKEKVLNECERIALLCGRTWD